MCRHLHDGQHFVGVSGQRHLLLRATSDGTLHDDFGAAWAAYGAAVVPPSVEAVDDDRHAQRLWEQAFNEGRPRPPRPGTIRVIGIELVRKLEWEWPPG